MTVQLATTKKSALRTRPIPALIFLVISFFVLTPSSLAQGPTPSPTPTATPSNIPSEAGLPSAQLIKLMDLMRQLVPYMRRQIEKPLISKLRFLALILSSIILLFSFIRIIRENDGASTEL